MKSFELYTLQITEAYNIYTPWHAIQYETCSFFATHNEYIGWNKN